MDHSMTAEQTAALGQAIYRAVERLDPPIDLLAALGSLGDTLEPQEVIEMLNDMNDSPDGQLMRSPH